MWLGTGWVVFMGKEAGKVKFYSAVVVKGEWGR
jgi:hypothetical protein